MDGNYRKGNGIVEGEDVDGVGEGTIQILVFGMGREEGILYSVQAME
jgi:hypothetical protein